MGVRPVGPNDRRSAAARSSRAQRRTIDGIAVGAGRAASCAPHPLAIRLGEFDEVPDRRRKRRDVAGRDEQTVHAVPDGVRRAVADVGGDRDASRGHRLDEDERKALRAAGGEQEGCGGEPVARVGSMPVQPDAGDAEPGDEGLEFGPAVALSVDVESHVGEPGCRDRPDGEIDLLARGERGEHDARPRLDGGPGRSDDRFSCAFGMTASDGSLPRTASRSARWRSVRTTTASKFVEPFDHPTAALPERRPPVVPDLPGASCAGGARRRRAAVGSRA